jgi:transcription antitermination factor NusA-like protein
LRAEIHVPTTLIGRLVGKGGQNVRQLQQSTGATSKLPEDSQQTSAREIPVKIFGSFQASQVRRQIDFVASLPLASFSLLNDVFNRLFK